MYFAGHWIPMQLATKLLVLWLVAAAVLTVLVIYLRRRGKSEKPDHGVPRTPGVKRHRKRK